MGMSIFAIILVVILFSVIGIGVTCIIACIVFPDFGEIIGHTIRRLACYCCGLCTLGFFCLFPILMVTGILFLLFIIWLTGNSGLSLFYTFISFFFQILQLILGVWNPISLIVPHLMTLVNLFLKLVVLFFRGLLGLFCFVQFWEPGFNAQTHCPVLWTWVSTAPTIAEILKNTIEFIVFIVEIGVFVLFPGTCVRKCTNISLFPLTCTIDGSCEAMCSELGLLPGCFKFTTAVTWIFTDWNILEFLVNYFDFFLGILILTPFIFILNEIFLFKLIYDCPSWCWDTVGGAHNYYATYCIANGFCTQSVTIFKIIENIIVSDGKVFGQFFLALFFQYVAVIIDWIFCNFFSPANVKCILNLLCHLLLDPIVLPIIGSLGNLCPSKKNCPCNACRSGWTIFTGYGGPCTLEPGCKCTAAYKFMARFVSFIILLW